MEGMQCGASPHCFSALDFSVVLDTINAHIRYILSSLVHIHYRIPYLRTTAVHGLLPYTVHGHATSIRHVVMTFLVNTLSNHCSKTSSQLKTPTSDTFLLCNDRQLALQQENKTSLPETTRNYQKLPESASTTSCKLQTTGLLPPAP